MCMRDLKLVGQQTCTWCWLEHSRERHLLFRRSDRAVLAYFCDLDCYFSESRCDAGTGRLCRALVLQPYTCEEHFPSRVLISVFCFFPSKRNVVGTRCGAATAAEDSVHMNLQASKCAGSDQRTPCSPHRAEIVM